MIDYIHISLPFSPEMPSWHGNFSIKLERCLDKRREDLLNDTSLRCSDHTGTHVDAPLHFLVNGVDVSRLPLDSLLGIAVVAWLPNTAAVTAQDLDSLTLPSVTERLRKCTRTSEWWARGEHAFRKDFVALTSDTAQWVVDWHLFDRCGLSLLAALPRRP